MTLYYVKRFLIGGHAHGLGKIATATHTNTVAKLAWIVCLKWVEPQPLSSCFGMVTNSLRDFSELHSYLYLVPVTESGSRCLKMNRLPIPVIWSLHSKDQGNYFMIINLCLSMSSQLRVQLRPARLHKLVQVLGLGHKGSKGVEGREHSWIAVTARMAINLYFIVCREFSTLFPNARDYAADRLQQRMTRRPKVPSLDHSRADLCTWQDRYRNKICGWLWCWASAWIHHELDVSTCPNDFYFPPPDGSPKGQGWRRWF